MDKADRAEAVKAALTRPGDLRGYSGLFSSRRPQAAFSGL